MLMYKIIIIYRCGFFFHFSLHTIYILLYCNMCEAADKHRRHRLTR
jgi:hypothetical protein